MHPLFIALGKSGNKGQFLSLFEEIEDLRELFFVLSKKDKFSTRIKNRSPYRSYELPSEIENRGDFTGDCIYHHETPIMDCFILAYTGLPVVPMINYIGKNKQQEWSWIRQS